MDTYTHGQTEATRIMGHRVEQVRQHGSVYTHIDSDTAIRSEGSRQWGDRLSHAGDSEKWRPTLRHHALQQPGQMSGCVRFAQQAAKVTADILLLVVHRDV